MNQQPPTAVLSAYPAPKASDGRAWQELIRARIDAQLAHPRNVQRTSDGDASSEQSLMSQRIQKMLMITRSAWATR